MSLPNTVRSCCSGRLAQCYHGLGSENAPVLPMHVAIGASSLRYGAVIFYLLMNVDGHERLRAGVRGTRPPRGRRWRKSERSEAAGFRPCASDGLKSASPRSTHRNPCAWTEPPQASRSERVYKCLPCWRIRSTTAGPPWTAYTTPRYRTGAAWFVSCGRRSTRTGLGAIDTGHRHSKLCSADCS